MKFKDLLLPLSVALVATWALQYFLSPRKPDNRVEIAADRSFVAPSSVQVAEPLDFDIDFSDAQSTRPKQLTQINLPYGTIQTSNDGAIIDYIAFKRTLAGKESLIETLIPSTSKEGGAFLVALNGFGNTPYYYDLVEKKEEPGYTSVTYRGESKSAVITKQFIFNHDKYVIDLKVTVEPKGAESSADNQLTQSKNVQTDRQSAQDVQMKKGSETQKAESKAETVLKQQVAATANKEDISLRPRLFFPAPLATGSVVGGEIRTADTSSVVQAVLFTEGKAIEKRTLKGLDQFGKERPSLFGLEDHYFADVLIKDPQHFAQRAYFKLEGTTARGVLQAQSVPQRTTWELSFYFGPKEMKALSKADPRLEGLLDYGWFAPLSKLMLFLLNFFYDLVQNYGIAIILVTLLVRLLLVPFTLGGEKSRRQHLEAQKKLQYLEQKYKHDPELLAREKAEFARKHGLPGMLGCLPLLLQIPVFVALQRVLTNAIELYKAPFLWISDLSARDPYYILPALVAIGMVLQMAQTGDARQRVANILMAIIIAAITANLSAGLTLFIAVSTFLGLLQTWIQKALKL